MDEDKILDDLAAHAVAEQKAKARGVQATQFLDKLRDVLAWLKANGVDFWAIVAKIPAIVALLMSGGADWLSVWNLILSLFGKQPMTTAAVP